MRTAADFDQFYAVADPWRISRSGFRDRILRRCISKIVSEKTVLELGCGEGHLTQAIFDTAASVTGIDLSEIALQRARARGLANARFENANFLTTSFRGFDVIAAIECVYYLTPEDQDAFFARIRRDHRGKLLILSGPIIGQNEHRNYFTHRGLIETFAHHGLSLIEFHNLNVERRGIATTIAAALSRLLGGVFLDHLPSGLIRQRCYILRA